MTETVDIANVRARFDELVAAAAGGTEVVIVKDDRPIARLVAACGPTGKRVAGLGRGEVWVSDDFDAPLSDEFWTGME